MKRGRRLRAGGGLANGSYRGKSLERRGIHQSVAGRIHEEAVVAQKINAEDWELDVSQ